MLNIWFRRHFFLFCDHCSCCAADVDLLFKFLLDEASKVLDGFRGSFFGRFLLNRVELHLKIHLLFRGSFSLHDDSGLGRWRLRDFGLLLLSRGHSTLSVGSSHLVSGLSFLLNLFVLLSLLGLPLVRAEVVSDDCTEHQNQDYDDHNNNDCGGSIVTFTIWVNRLFPAFENQSRGRGVVTFTLRINTSNLEVIDGVFFQLLQLSFWEFESLSWGVWCKQTSIIVFFNGSGSGTWGH